MFLLLPGKEKLYPTAFCLLTGMTIPISEWQITWNSGLCAAMNAICYLDTQNYKINPTFKSYFGIPEYNFVELFLSIYS